MIFGLAAVYTHQLMREHLLLINTKSFPTIPYSTFPDSQAEPGSS